MMSEFLKELLPIGVILTFLGTLITIYNTRKNLTTTKYVDTITSERIKWLSIIRDEVTELVSKISMTLKIYEKEIKEKELERNDFQIKPEDETDNQLKLYYEADPAHGLKETEYNWSANDFLKKLYLLKLRINPQEDSKISTIIDFFVSLYMDNNSISSSQISVAKNKLNLLIDETQILIKNEWEKVKNESKGKIANKDNIKLGILGYIGIKLYKSVKWLIIRD